MKIPVLWLALATTTAAFGAETAPASKAVAPAATVPFVAITTPGWKYEETRRLAAPEAGQGAVADGEFIYAINNHTIAKYRKTTGERVALWEGGAKGGDHPSQRGHSARGKTLLRTLKLPRRADAELGGDL